MFTQSRRELLGSLRAFALPLKYVEPQLVLELEGIVVNAITGQRERKREVPDWPRRVRQAQRTGVCMMAPTHDGFLYRACILYDNVATSFATNGFLRRLKWMKAEEN
jgi:hypothetical protein